MKQKLYGLVGHNIQFSLSPCYMNTGFKRLGENSKYLLLDTEAKDLPRTFDMIRKFMSGVNVTAPYKQKIFKYLDSYDKSAIEAKAVNLVLNNGGILTGYNTDGPGTIDALQKDGKVKPSSIRFKSAVIVGAGGMASAIYQAIRAWDMCYPMVLNRSKKLFYAGILAGNITPRLLVPENLKSYLQVADLMVSCTPNAAWTPELIEAARPFLQRGGFVLNCDYNGNDALIRAARKEKAPNVSGISLFFRIAARSFELFTRKPYPTKEVNK